MYTAPVGNLIMVLSGDKSACLNTCWKLGFNVLTLGMLKNLLKIII